MSGRRSRREDRRTIISALAEQLMANGEKTDRLLAETYGFPDEIPRTPLRNAQEYATLLNACGRWSKPQIGGAILRGDRGTAYREAEHMLNNHRAIIRNLLQFIIDTGVKELENLQYLHVGDRFPDTIVGIGAGMALSKLNSSKPILIMCEVPEDHNLTKVSMRTTERVVEKGIDLQQALSDASAEYGGGGRRAQDRGGSVYPENSRRGVCDSCQQDTRRTVCSGASRPLLTTSSAAWRAPGSSPKGARSSSRQRGGYGRSSSKGSGSRPSGHRTAG